MIRPKSLEEIITAVTQINSRLERLESSDIDLHGRRIVNAGAASGASDYATLSDIKTLISSVDTADSNNQNNSGSSQFSEDITILKVRPELKLKYSGDTTFTRVFHHVSGVGGAFSANLDYNGSAWVPDDAAIVGQLILIRTTDVGFFTFPVAGALTAVCVIDNSGNIQLLAGGKVSINGNQIITSRQTDIGAPATQAAVTAGTAPATYNATAQSLLQSLISDVANIKTTLDDYKTRLTNQRSVNQTHGLTA